MTTEHQFRQTRMGGKDMGTGEHSSLSRRKFLKTAGMSALAAAAATGAFSMTGCSSNNANAEEPIKHVGGGVADYSESVYTDVFPLQTRNMPIIDAPCETTRQGTVAYVAGDIPENQINRTETCDVLVAGAGWTGVCAALAASDDGHTSVFCFEKMSKGRGIFEGAGVVGGRVMEAAGNNVDKAEMMDRMRHAAYYRVPVDPIKLWADRSGEAVDWLQDRFDEGDGQIETYFHRGSANAHNFDVPQTEIAFRSPQWSEQTTSNAGGAGIYIVADLANTFQKRSNADLRYNTAVCKLERNDDGVVTGAICQDSDGYFRVNANNGVILATGGFDANPAMLKAWCRAEDIANTTSWAPTEGTTGDGQLMGLEIGGQMDPLPAAIMNFDFGNPEAYYSRGANRLVGQGLLINENGIRFASESLPFQARGNAISAQRHYGSDCWRVVSQTQIDPFRRQRADDWSDVQTYFDYCQEKGYLVTGSTVEELATNMGVPADNLVETINRYNQFVDNRKDEDFNKPMQTATKMEGNEFWAFKEQQCILATVSGLVVDYYCHVLDYDDNPIEHLYAAGGASGGFFSGNYPRHIFGPSAGRCLTFGYVSGQNAARGI